MTLGGVLLVAALVAVALLIYPGELSQVSSASHRWLYDRSAGRYERKWRSPPYTDSVLTDRIGAYAAASCRDSGLDHVLDLGCGTGRGVRIVAPFLADSATFTCIDFSKRMLDEFSAWLATSGTSLADRVTLIEQSLDDWATSPAPDTVRYGLVLLLEVGEFLPEFDRTVERAAALTGPRGGLVMTRPAGAWCWAFPGRNQSRKGLRRVLESSGYCELQFLPWRSRYELVIARKR